MKCNTYYISLPCLFFKIRGVRKYAVSCLSYRGESFLLKTAPFNPTRNFCRSSFADFSAYNLPLRNNP